MKVKVDPEVIARCIDREGWVKGALLAEFVGEWTVAAAELGDELGIEEFAEWWRDSRSTAYRRLAAFRRAFPELGPEGVPTDLFRAQQRATGPERSYGPPAVA